MLFCSTVYSVNCCPSPEPSGRARRRPRVRHGGRAGHAARQPLIVGCPLDDAVDCVSMSHRSRAIHHHNRETPTQKNSARRGRRCIGGWLRPTSPLRRCHKLFWALQSTWWYRRGGAGKYSRRASERLVVSRSQQTRLTLQGQQQVTTRQIAKNSYSVKSDANDRSFSVYGKRNVITGVEK